MTIDDLNLELESAEEQMQHALDHLDKELTNIRAGKVSPSMLNHVMVPYYGTNTPINQVSNVGVVDGRTLSIQPWEKSMLSPIEKAIFAANLGVTPQNDGIIIRITIPPLTEERRRQLVKQARDVGEHSKVGVRKARQECKDAIHKLVKAGLSEDIGKDGESQLQELTQKYTEKIDKLVTSKEKDIMAI